MTKAKFTITEFYQEKQVDTELSLGKINKW